VIEMSEIELRARLEAPVGEVWHAWTDSDAVTKWFSPHANIEPRLGGAYELFFDPANHEHQCTKGCRITRFEPYARLSFSWRGPEELHHVMDPCEPQTHVHVSLKERGAETEVAIVHDGWGTGEDWKAARDWHQRAWEHVVRSIERYFNEEKEGRA
jgi:uncharacterized protein YndB with AHSA1/START domain